MKAERVILTGQGQKPQRLPLPRGQDPIGAGGPDQPLYPEHSAKRAAIDEVTRRHVDDQAPTRRHQGRDSCLSIRRVSNV
jgi:hypothetical protein